MSICEQLGAWAAALAEEDLSDSVRERARLQRAAIHAAAHAGRDAAAPFGAGAPDGPLGAVYMSAAASIAHDWDDYLFMGHTGHSAVAVADAFADGSPVAQVAANEVAGRLGLALFVGPHNGQFWASIHCASAAIAAGIGLGLDGERLAHALAIALYQPPYGLWPGFMGPSTKLLTAADPAVVGARAALLAANGVDGPLGVIEDDRGLLTHLAFVRRPRAFDGLGEVWLTDTIAFKPRPGCAYLQAAVDAALQADAEALEIEAVEISAGYLTVAMEALGASAGLRPVGVTFSARLSVAIALLAGRLTHAELDPAWLGANRRRIEDLVARTRLRHDWDLTLATIEGAARGGASLGDVPWGAWPRVGRRLRELGMADAALGLGELRPLVRDRALLRRLRAAAFGQGRGGTAALDTAALRMTFPCRLEIRLRDGRRIGIEGGEPGASGHPLAEQHAVVERKCASVGMAPLGA